jgi:hypothetical protein
MVQKDIRKRFEKALGHMLSDDIDLLERNAAERAIGGRLAAHLSVLFPDHNVDVEYDRHGLKPKAVELPPFCRGGGRKRVIPDIVVHRRGIDTENLLVVELKKETNREPRDCDRAKLRALREQLGYQAAVFVDLPAGSGAKGRAVTVEWH